jgi:hypothetical protein
MDDVMSGRKPRSLRRRWVLWAVFGTVGLIMGAAYATGFTSTNNTSSDANAGEATQLFGKPATANPSQYANMVSTTNPLAVAFDGNYGTLTSTVMFTVDLTQHDPYGNALTGTYYSDIVLTNWNALGLTGANPAWDTIELKFLGVECDNGFTTWTPAGANGPANASAQMHVDRDDAHVTFTGMAAGHKYCFGLDNATALTQAAVLQAAAGGTVDGTVLFRPNAAPAATLPAAPQFAATVNRSA